ncbi:hypothetical protein ACET3X_002523 [Alternaria dauci]|uniref:Uncharacterized protein n=1 Tax=Alternaria dauci TaxID=48095 RepID=A0ABR3UST7_9PLEO
MVTIVAIPTYYQAYSYVFLYARSPDVHPTTTTRYIVLIPASTEALTTRNAAIAKDVAAWGWRVYITDPSAPNMKKWLKKYYKAVSTQTWDDDIWRIWQREHGLKIAWADMQRKDKEASEKGKKGKFVHGVKKAGMYFGKDGVIICSDEQRLRKEEERRWKLADNRIARRFEDLPDDPFVNPPIQSGRSIDKGDSKVGNLRDGSGVDAKETTLAETAASDVEPLTRHSWLA